MYKLAKLYLIFFNFININGYNVLFNKISVNNKNNYLNSKSNILMKFEENDDFDINGYSFNKTIFNKNINSNIEIELNESYNDENFPSFEKFLKNKKAKDEEEILKYFKQAEEKERRMKERYENIEPTSKDLKLLNNVATIEWSKNWIHDMVSYSNSFPKFMYQDMFLMKDFAIENKTKNYFYIGYFPSNTRLMHGPYFIGSFELIPKNREFQTHLIIQNPNYMIEDEVDSNRIIEYKKELVNMAHDAMVFFKYSNLKNSLNERYYYSWLYEDN